MKKRVVQLEEKKTVTHTNILSTSSPLHAGGATYDTSAFQSSENGSNRRSTLTNDTTPRQKQNLTTEEVVEVAVSHVGTHGKLTPVSSSTSTFSEDDAVEL